MMRVDYLRLVALNLRLNRLHNFEEGYSVKAVVRICVKRRVFHAEFVAGCSRAIPPTFNLLTCGLVGLIVARSNPVGEYTNVNIIAGISVTSQSATDA